MRPHNRSALLARNSMLNALGQVLPLLVALPAVPYVLHGTGAERFAILTLAWTLIGYFGFLDLGLGRAATRFAAAAVGSGRTGELRPIVWSSLSIQVVMGMFGAALIAVAAPFVVHTLLRIADTGLAAEATRSLTAVALGLPLVLVSGTWSGVLEAHQRFDLINAVRVPANIATLAVPTIGVALGWTLPAMVYGIVAGRALAMLVFAALAWRVAGGLAPVRPHGSTLGHLLRYGGWLTVSLLAVPLLTYAERLLVGGLRSLDELAWYAVAYEIVARTAIIPSAIAFTLFPAFSHAQQQGSGTAALFRRPLRLLFLLEWPLLAAFWLFAGEILHVWVGAEAAAGASALRLLALAFFLNAFSQIALAGVQGLGRPDLKAKLDVIEVPLFVACAALLIPRYGIAGAAAAKLAITIIDTVALFAFARRLGAPPLVSTTWLRAQPLAAVLVAVLMLGTLAAVAAPLALRAALFVASAVLVSGACWSRALDATDRAAVRTLLGRRLRVEEAPS
jgi:O-antigen/teichoic acid export membrane protein